MFCKAVVCVFRGGGGECRWAEQDRRGMLVGNWVLTLLSNTHGHLRTRGKEERFRNEKTERRETDKEGARQREARGGGRFTPAGGGLQGQASKRRDSGTETEKNKLRARQRREGEGGQMTHQEEEEEEGHQD